MAALDPELEKLVKEYIDSTLMFNKSSLRTLLQPFTVQDRIALIIDVGGETNAGSNILHAACNHNDVETAKLLLDGLSADETFNMLKITSTMDDTPLHITVAKGNTVLAKYFLERLSLQQKLDILKMQDKKGNTAPHIAAKTNKTELFQLMLTSITPDQQMELLNVENTKEQSVLDKIPQQLCCFISAQNSKALGEATDKITHCNKRIKELEEEGQRQTQIQEHAEGKLVAYERKLELLETRVIELEEEKNQQAQDMQAMATRQGEMQTLLNALQLSISAPIVIYATGDQELEELDH